MKIVRYFYCFLIVSIIANCSGSERLLYPADSPLPGEIAISSSSGLKVKIPEGWYAAEANDSLFVDLWLIKKDFSASMAFIPIYLNENFPGEEIEVTNPLTKALNYCKTFRKAALKDGFKIVDDLDLFKISQKNFAAFEYSSPGKYGRVVVFKFKNKFYECSTNLPFTGNNSINKDLFRVQNSVLSSLE